MRKAAEEAALIRKGKLDLLRRKDAGYQCPGHRNPKARRHCERPKSEAHPPDRPISRHMLLADRFSCAVWWNEIGGISPVEGGALSEAIGKSIRAVRLRGSGPTIRLQHRRSSH